MIMAKGGCPVVEVFLLNGVLPAMVEAGMIDVDTYLLTVLGEPHGGPLPMDEQGDPDLATLFAGEYVPYEPPAAPLAAGWRCCHCPASPAA